ncbi:S41 family peptidase [Streptomyces avicenniae]|uniref:S41 family peptidase n=1 Tax=Streptomyces avicenniae TaxID=500153 RepID=UPI00069B562C|nr:S41 family peptidase [Streptomyces avicenniae]
MSRASHSRSPHSVRRGATLAGVFLGVLVTGAATGSWPESAARGADAPVADAELLVNRSGDRWASAYSPEEYERLRHALAGEYVGTGIAVVRTAAGRVEVSEVHADSPAERAGVLAGDTLRTVDGVPVDGRAVTDTVARLRGSDEPSAAGPGSTVRVGLERDGRHWSAVVARARLTTEPVSVSRDAPGVTRVRVASFTQGTAELLRDAVASAPAGDGLVLDLRGNAGGLLTEAAGAASVFLDGGLVATYDVHGEQRALHAEPGGDTRTPLVVLVDGGTMSSAELVTGALQDRGRAVVVGGRTFGKGTVQMPSVQPDGSVAELTVGHYATPSGRVVDEDGLVPDLVVGPGEDAQESAGTVLGGLAGSR